MWSLERSQLVYTHSKMRVYWEVPPDFMMPSEALRHLAEALLLNGSGEAPALSKATRSPGRRVALAYSGGVDSTAALELLPGAIPIYTEVDDPGKLHRIENALLALAEVDGVAVKTNSDMLATHFGRKRGFYGAGGFTITSILYADYYDVGIVADGNIIDAVYLQGSSGHGTVYNRKDHAGLAEKFATAGLEYCMPCSGLTEVATTRIVGDRYKYVMGCMRGRGGEPCLRCAKCYRKEALKGNPIPPCEESEVKIAKDLIPVLPALLWAAKYEGLRHPVLDGIRKDISWVDKWYGDSIKYVPVSLRSEFLARLSDFGIEAIVDDAPLVSWVSDRG